MRVLWRVLFAVLAIIGTVTVLLTAAGVATLVSLADHAGSSLPERMVLTLDLDDGVSEGATASPLGRLSAHRRHDIESLLESLTWAAADPRVTALSVEIGDTTFGLAQAEQIRRAIATFGRSGKPTYLFSDSLDGTIACHVASGFDEVWLQPSGSVDFKGFMVESPFLRKVLDDLGIEADISSRHEYKMAPEIVTATRFSDPSRESLGSLLSSWTGQVVASVANRRRLTPEKVRALIDRAPLLATEALEAGLVDRLGYRGQMRDAVAARAGTTETVDIRSYHARHKTPDTDHRIALIHGIGTIQRGTSHFSPASANAVMGADTIAKAIADAVEDEDVEAILFRVDSPGGDYVAADTIWHEVRRAREKGKPVVVSMGNTAASGGYFVAMAADAIVAEPGTITGSIGVFSGKFVLRRFWDRLGVNWDEIHVGANAPMWSFNQSFTPEQRRRFDRVLDVIYADFTTKAASARNLTAEEIDRAARGRVFSGIDAAQLGLVDELGGLETAVEVIRKKASIPADAPVTLVPFPAPKDLGRALFDALSSGELPLDLEELEGYASLARVAKTLEPLLRAVGIVAPRTGQLMAPDITVR
ncbi:MAG: signal peptide peptidase SppA [Alphaproteobacteria bacterium]